MQKVTLMFLPLNWNAGSVSVVTVSRTLETAQAPSHLRKGYQSGFYLLLLFSPCPLPSNCCPVRPKYPVPGKVTEPWPLGLHSIRADRCNGRYSPELPRHWSLFGNCQTSLQIHATEATFVPSLKAFFNQFLRTVHGHPFPSTHYALE